MGVHNLTLRVHELPSRRPPPFFFPSSRSHEAIPLIISIAHVSIILTALKHFRLGTHGALISILQLPKPKDDEEANAASHKPVSSFRSQVAAGSHL